MLHQERHMPAPAVPRICQSFDALSRATTVSHAFIERRGFGPPCGPPRPYGQLVSCEAYPVAGSHISSISSKVNPITAMPLAIHIGNSLRVPTLGRTR